MLLPLPWTTVADHEGIVVVSATELQLRRWRDIPAFLVASLGLRRSFHRAPGAIGVGLAAAPLRRRFLTLTVWRDETSALAYVRSPEHTRVMRRFRSALGATRSARWTMVRRSRPGWSDALDALDRAAEVRATAVPVHAA